MIIVEGPDGAGKSRLAQRLRDDLNWPIAEKAVGADTVPLVDMGRWLDENLYQGFHPVIYDRHRLISEPIYGPWVRGEVGMDFQDPNRLWAWFVEFHIINPIIIFCRPPLENVMQNLADDDEGMNDRLRAEMPGIYWQYHCLYISMTATWGMGREHNISSWDYTQHNYTDLMTWIKNCREFRALGQGRRV